MQSWIGNLIRRQALSCSDIAPFRAATAGSACGGSTSHGFSWLMPDSSVPGGAFHGLTSRLFRSFHHLGPQPSPLPAKFGCGLELLNGNGKSSCTNLPRQGAVGLPLSRRSISTVGKPVETPSRGPLETVTDVPPRIKFKRLDKTANHIMRIVDKEAVEEVKSQREMPDIKPGYIVQLKVEVPENKRRVSILKGIVIARRNAGLNTTFRLRRVVAGVGIESLFPLYSPNIKEIKVLDKKKVRRAKLYYLRDKMNALNKKK